MTKTNETTLSLQSEQATIQHLLDEQ